MIADMVENRLVIDDLNDQELEDFKYLSKELFIRDLPSLVLYLVHDKAEDIKSKKSVMEKMKGSDFGAIARGFGTALGKTLSHDTDQIG